ncbi:tellurite resistance TerB family protein [Almyronema epifaneia]|uniref:TerB family tellurite resistance protein n=1 Tax=Almyronema epifaneia S1 TaxID=2991925 RepID=A0ABW6IGX6_9CYAN
MGLQPPPPPSISPRQMNMMRIVASMAWSDGNLETNEVELMLNRFSSLFASDQQQQQQLQEELHAYLMQNIPLHELTPKLKTEAERELVLRLGYEVISASVRSPGEAAINNQEADAYQQLVKLLDLPPAIVKQVEAEAEADLQNEMNLIDRLTDELKQFLQS